MNLSLDAQHLGNSACLIRILWFKFSFLTLSFALLLLSDNTPPKKAVTIYVSNQQINNSTPNDGAVQFLLSVTSTPIIKNSLFSKIVPCAKTIVFSFTINWYSCMVCTPRCSLSVQNKSYVCTIRMYISTASFMYSTT
ncbi:hypothetical protein VCUG_02105 [Vavraia culicis subsp. floridensis]|uniref:Uncharacterized protein n=1 Tax=Vavraia culicis (isolate floridensis) TaxID=948595 RepID=L2GSV0_VAVCU|nr:uncharacterized protein VCUG_02105 [Vavraia culicis subsp. floridensis]ELA46427.1 hypothetical protein VCUG_02105 [Vavraia culicis subsp. floridensis]